MRRSSTHQAQTWSAATTRPEAAPKRVLNAGSGPSSARGLHPVFDVTAWQEVRFDVDAHAAPDVVGTVTHTAAIFPPRSFDAIWSSHTLEHLHAHEVVPALRQFRWVLKTDGFALVTCPDLEAVASLVLHHGLDFEAYTAPAGPITPLDMLFGHSASVADGNYHMCHKTGFTCARLGDVLLQAGFPTVLAKRGEQYDLWALALMEDADKQDIQRRLHRCGLDMFDDED